MATAHAPFRSLPDDVLQRLLVGLPLEDHRAAASVCKSFRGVIAGPRFLAERRRCGFAERGIVSVKSTHGDLTICMAHSGETARIPGSFWLTTCSTTDGGRRLFSGTGRSTARSTARVLRTAQGTMVLRRVYGRAGVPTVVTPNGLYRPGSPGYVSGGLGAAVAPNGIPKNRRGGSRGRRRRLFVDPRTFFGTNH